MLSIFYWCSWELFELWAGELHLELLVITIWSIGFSGSGDLSCSPVPLLIKVFCFKSLTTSSLSTVMRALLLLLDFSFNYNSVPNIMETSLWIICLKMLFSIISSYFPSTSLLLTMLGIYKCDRNISSNVIFTK